MWGIIATWTMSEKGVEKAKKLLEQGKSGSEVIMEAIKDVEDNEFFKSVGYGGLPNEEMVVELDAGYMDGTSLDFGSIGAIKDYKNPIEIAQSLSKYKENNVLVSIGAEKYAHKMGFKCQNMLTERAKKMYEARVEKIKTEGLRPYSGHDTVGMVCLDQHQNMYVGTSTSGLFMKKSGRLGDSPIIGSGFYVDSDIGGASATGLGEDLMKGCISYQIVQYMKQGYHPQKACEKAAFELEELLIKRREKAGDISVVAMNNKGEWGAATTIDTFSFVVATNTEPLTIYQTKRNDNNEMIHTKASQKWIDDYYASRMKG